MTGDEFFFTKPKCDQSIQDLYSEPLRPRLKAALSDMPVSLHTATVRGFPTHKAQVDASHNLGARILVVHSDEFLANEPGALDIPLCRNVVTHAAERGVYIALENGQLPFLEQAIAEVDGLRSCLDVGHIYLTDVPMPDFLTALKSHIVHLHLQDVLSTAETEVPHAGADHYALGTGGIPDQG